MATRAIKGVFTRNAWDFFESSSAFAFGDSGTNPAGTYFVVLTNNATGPGNLDVYRGVAYAANPTGFGWIVLPPGFTQSTISPAAHGVSLIDTSHGAPVGAITIATSVSALGELALQGGFAANDGNEIELKNGGPFVTLEPGWAIAVGSGSNCTRIKATFWYQVILDQVVPAH